MSRYDVNAANLARTVRFRVEAANDADRDPALFGMHKGTQHSYPYYGQLTGTPTANQELAQIRTNFVVMALTSYAIPVGIALADDALGTGRSATAGSALLISYEVDEMGVFYNQQWPHDTTVNKHVTADIADTVGTGGMSYTKTKAGLQTLLDSLAGRSFDNGATGPFGNLSAGGAIVLPDGRVTAGAPTLDAAGAGVAAGTSGLMVTYLSAV